MSMLDHEAEQNIIQLGCNPAHVFHAECIESFDFCPECFVPIEKDAIHHHHSYMDEKSVGPPRFDYDSQEEDLLDPNHRNAAANTERRNEERKRENGSPVNAV